MLELPGNTDVLTFAPPNRRDHFVLHTADHGGDDHGGQGGLQWIAVQGSSQQFGSVHLRDRGYF